MLMKINYNFSTSELGIDISKFISYMTEKGIQRRAKIKDLKIVFPPMKSISLALVNPQYHHAFYTIQAFSFKGKFGNNPDVYMIFSKDDNPIKLRRLEQQVDTVVAVKAVATAVKAIATVEKASMGSITTTATAVADAITKKPTLKEHKPTSQTLPQ